MEKRIIITRAFTGFAFLGLACGVFAAQTPCGGATVDASPYVTLTWDAVANARSYTAEVTTNPSFTTGIQSFGAGSGTSTQATTLQNGTLYYWRVRSNSAQSWEPPIYTYGSVCTFSTSVPTQVPQFAPQQSQPSNNSTVVSGTVLLNWTMLGGATAYEVQWSTNPTMSSSVLSSGVITAAQWTVTTVSATTYYWRVRAYNSVGAASWTISPIWRFDTESAVTPLVIKVLLQGPLVTTPSVAMTDGLRSTSLVPTSEPYTFGPTFYNLSNPFATITPAQLAVTGATAIVDWVVLQARHGATNAPLKAWVMIVRKDGSVVLPSGSNINESLPMKNVKFSVHHRNHLGAMTANAVDATGAQLTVDFTSTATALYGTDPTYIVAGKRALWAGDCNGNGTILYTGSGNDRDQVLSAIGGVVPTNSVTGYLSTDLNMDGTVKYTGSGNDRDIILSVIGGVVPTNSRVQQLP